MANPIHYTQNSGFPSVISWPALDYIKNYVMSRKWIAQNLFTYVMFLRGGVVRKSSLIKDEHLNFLN